MHVRDSTANVIFLCSFFVVFKSAEPEYINFIIVLFLNNFLMSPDITVIIDAFAH